MENRLTSMLRQVGKEK